jgi:hypothetical protein
MSRWLRAGDRVSRWCGGALTPQLPSLTAVTKSAACSIQRGFLNRLPLRGITTRGSRPRRGDRCRRPSISDRRSPTWGAIEKRVVMGSMAGRQIGVVRVGLLPELETMALGIGRKRRPWLGPTTLASMNPTSPNSCGVRTNSSSRSNTRKSRRHGSRSAPCRRDRPGRPAHEHPNGAGASRSAGRRPKT